MGSPFVGEIRMFGGSFAPAGWAMCDGQLLPISENETLFNLIGTTYGGDGQATFALPDLQGRFPVHMGTNPGTGTNFQLSEKAGTEEVTLTVQQIPVHTHTPNASSTGNSDNPQDDFWAATTTGKPYGTAPGADIMGAASIQPAGGSQPHENMDPFLVVTYIISLFGIFPTQL